MTAIQSRNTVGAQVLNFMWLKFLLIWRFFRLCALATGIEAPENMLRCVNNNYDFEGFWRCWHASYNRWLVRYLYIPLGGSRWKLLNVWLIFTFVALWHDLEWRLLSWAWLTCALVVPEILVKALVQRMPHWQEGKWFRVCCAFGGAFSIAGLMSANLVGFVIGVRGIKIFLGKLLVAENAGLVLAIAGSFYISAQLMLEVREGERGAAKLQQVEEPAAAVERSFDSTFASDRQTKKV
eukprot:SM000402S15221  [mRNA]  locus=s402:32308:34203:+ [translate_table: standard]